MSGLTDFAAAASGCLPQSLAVFFALLIGHAICDFPLQGPFLAAAKNRHTPVPTPKGGEPLPRNVWAYALSAHSLIHAAPVWLITGSATLALVEVVLHWIIDYSKCEGCMHFGADQLFHVLCKLGYAVVLFFGLLH